MTTIARLSQTTRTLLCTTLVLLLAACAASPRDTGSGSQLEPTPTSQGQAGEPQVQPDGKLAQVESVELLILESFPVQVHALVKGNLADGCTEIDRIEDNRDVAGRAFEVTITTSRDPEKMCSQALVPFEETVPLDVRDLAKGTYSVDVNGVKASFELQMDNKLQ